MVKIRLARFGKKNDPFYRVIAIEEGKKREGAAKEILGYFNPREKKLQIDKKAIALWVEKGAIVTPAVKKLMQ